MRISDWSSDVCSSDLTPREFRRPIIRLEIGRIVIKKQIGRHIGREARRRRRHGIGNRRQRAVLIRPAEPDRADQPEIDLTRRSEEHTSELQSLMRISYAVFCLKKKKKNNKHIHYRQEVPTINTN